MQYDVTIVGSGPGGYVAAIRCAQLGFKTAIVEKYNVLGGTCLNVGCIPSKALLDSSEHFAQAKKNFKMHGITVSGLKMNLAQMIKRKDDVVMQNVSGIAYLMKKNRVDVYTGVGSFVDPHTIRVQKGADKPSTLSTKHVIIATGSKPAALPFAPFGKRVISSTEALNLKKVPARFIVVGGGAIGMELGSVYARVGAKVTVVEFMDRLISNMDATLSRELLKVSKKDGIAFYLGHQVKAIREKGKEVVLEAVDKQGKEVSIAGDYCLVSVGRKPYTEGLNLEKVGVETDDKGAIVVDDHLKTKLDNVYAIGDVVRGPMLAHKAEEEGMMVAEYLAGQRPHIDYLLIPNVVYTWPEVAGVGYTEEQLKQAGRAYKVGSFPYKALGRARASMDMEGQVKVLADKQTDELLGIHIIGARAADMIAAGVTAMTYRASAEDVSRMSHAHPTYMEAVKEACLAATENRPIHV